MSNARLHDLRLLLQKALELEFFTVGPYLTALYSMHEAGNFPAAPIIPGVVMEEMLHMALVANVMNAIGGAPCVSPDVVNEGSATPGWRLEIRTYPSPVPHVDLDVNIPLERFSEAAIRRFSKIEEPEPPES